MCDHVLDRQLSRGMFASDFGDSSRKHPTELARGRLENPPSKLEIQRATAILQVAPQYKIYRSGRRLLRGALPPASSFQPPAAGKSIRVYPPGCCPPGPPSGGSFLGKKLLCDRPSVLSRASSRMRLEREWRTQQSALAPREPA